MALIRSLTKAASQSSSWHALQCSLFNISIRKYEKLDKRVTDVVPFYQSPDIQLTDYPLPHHTSFAEYKPEIEELRKGLWPWNKGIRSRLPEFFKNHYLERYSVLATPVHYVPISKKYDIDDNGIKTRIPDVPLPIIFPKESDSGLWGGEGIVMGMRKKHNKFMKPKSLRVWKPSLFKRVFYSEILDQYLAITVTLRTLDLIDEALGFDSYILGTNMKDLHSKLGMRIKRAMLKTLSERTLYTNDKEKQNLIYDKYKKYLIPEEHIDWLGLTLPEAELKQTFLEAAEEVPSPPMKISFAQNLLSELHKEAEDKKAEEEKEKSKGLFSKLNPFKE